jgi:hypothetical protein
LPCTQPIDSGKRCHGKRKTGGASTAPDDDLKCPVCAAVDFKALGTKGFAGRQLAIILFGFPAGVIFSGVEKKTVRDKAVIYKCPACGNKWEALPVKAAESGCLETSCEIHVTRESGIIGRVMAWFVYLNGKKIGPVKNGGRIIFTTERKHNLVFVTDHSGRAFDTRCFDASAGEKIELSFRRKFR